MAKNNFNELGNTMVNLIIYIYPEYLNTSIYDQLRKGSRFNKKIVEKYWHILTAINWFTKKIGRYEVFFKYFYPKSNKITEYDALEHHIHAYLEDIETLKNKLIRFINELKNDIKRMALNRQEVDHAFKIVANNITEVFETSKIRGDHRHGEYKFVDPYSTDNEMAYIILSYKNLLTEKGLLEAEKRKKESFAKGKQWWSQNAQDNYRQLDQLVNEVAKRNKEYLYKLLDIKPIIKE